MKHATETAKVPQQHCAIAEALAANTQRIGTARHAILAASWARGDNPAICDEAVIDLLADLMHFCAARRIDFADCARIAENHFAAETTGGAS